MIDIYIDDVKCTGINDIKEGCRIDLKNPKSESLILVLTEDNFIDLYNRMKRRCETRGLIPIYNKGALQTAKSEAIKEFAEKLKNHIIEVDVSFGYGKEHYTEAVPLIEIENLVKEMTEKGGAE